MRRHIDLCSRVDEATYTGAPRTWDPKIAHAVARRRREQLDSRTPEHPATGTELIQARLAAARARPLEELDAAVVAALRQPATGYRDDVTIVGREIDIRY